MTSSIVLGFLGGVTATGWSLAATLAPLIRAGTAWLEDLDGAAVMCLCRLFLNVAKDDADDEDDDEELSVMMLIPPGRLKWFLFMWSIRDLGLGNSIWHMLHFLLMSTFDTDIEEFPLNSPDTGAREAGADDDWGLGLGRGGWTGLWTTDGGGRDLWGGLVVIVLWGCFCWGGFFITDGITDDDTDEDDGTDEDDDVSLFMNDSE